MRFIFIWIFFHFSVGSFSIILDENWALFRYEWKRFKDNSFYIYDKDIVIDKITSFLRDLNPNDISKSPDPLQKMNELVTHVYSHFSKVSLKLHTLTIISFNRIKRRIEKVVGVTKGNRIESSQVLSTNPVKSSLKLVEILFASTERAIAFPVNKKNGNNQKTKKRKDKTYPAFVKKPDNFLEPKFGHFRRQEKTFQLFNRLTEYLIKQDPKNLHIPQIYFLLLRDCMFLFAKYVSPEALETFEKYYTYISHYPNIEGQMQFKNNLRE